MAENNSEGGIPPIEPSKRPIPEAVVSHPSLQYDNTYDVEEAEIIEPQNKVPVPEARVTEPVSDLPFGDSDENSVKGEAAPEPEKSKEPSFEEEVNDLSGGDDPELKTEFAQNLCRGFKVGINRSHSQLINLKSKGDALFTTYSKKEFETKEEWKQFQDDWIKLAPVIREEIGRLKPESSAKAKPSEKVEKTPPSATKEDNNFVKNLSEAIHGKRLRQDEEYQEMLKDEEWNNKPLDSREAKAKAYYVDMTDEERVDFENRIDLNAACYAKRKVNTLAEMSEKVPYGEISTSETANLEAHVPGVVEARSLYISLLDRDTEIGRRADGSAITIRNAKGINKSKDGTDELTQVREYVRGNIRNTVLEGYQRKITGLGDKDLKKYHDRHLDDLENPDNEDIFRLKVLDAEQIAFNLLFLGNTFESLDSQWNFDSNRKPINRTRPPQITSELVNMGVKGAIKPLDSLINSLGKSEDKKKFVGKFGHWAYEQTLASNHGTELVLDDRKPVHLEEVRIIPTDRKGNEKLFWTVENGGRILNAPECYPVQMTKSVWEETFAETTDGSKVALIEYMRRGQAIPWHLVRGETMWKDYGSKLGKNGAVWDDLQGKTVFRRGEYENVGLWVQTVQNDLSEFGLSDNVAIKRWILYASTGIDDSKRAIHIRSGKTYIRKVIGDSSPGPTYLHDNQLFFPWDSEGFMGILS